MRTIIILIVSLLMIGCTPKIDFVSYQDTFKEWNREKRTDVVDSTASLVINVNTYKGLFQGRESFLSFKKHYYSIVFERIDTFYTEKDIKDFSAFIGHNAKDMPVIPKYCKVRINHISKENIVIEFEIRDGSLPYTLKGKFKLKLSKEFMEPYYAYKYYEN